MILLITSWVSTFFDLVLLSVSCFCIAKILFFFQLTYLSAKKSRDLAFIYVWRKDKKKRADSHPPDSHIGRLMSVQTLQLITFKTSTFTGWHKSLFLIFFVSCWITATPHCCVAIAREKSTSSCLAGHWCNRRCICLLDDTLNIFCKNSHYFLYCKLFLKKVMLL